MNNRDILDKEFARLNFGKGLPFTELLSTYKDIASNYACMENAIAILSDLQTNTSYIYYGGFAQTVGIDSGKSEEEVPSIWEEEILKLIHPDDLASKYLQELCFSHFIKRQPENQRADYYLASKLRMKNGMNGYTQVLHRIFYVTIPPDNTLWLALCLYNPLSFDIPAKCMIINSVNGQMTEIDKQDSEKILSARKKQVLNLIDRGLTSKEIAATLYISTNTVSRHRQEILGKLHVKNSIEACRVAKELKLI